MMQDNITGPVNRGLQILWLGAVFDEKTVLTAPAVSPAANRWQLGLINGLKENGISVQLIGHLPEPCWPRGRLRVKSTDARSAPGVEQQLIDYWNLPLLRNHSLSSSYCELIDKLESQLSNTRVVVTYNADSAVVAGAKYVRERYNIPWVCIVADGEAPLDADGYVFLAWGYYKSFWVSKPKLHLDGGVPEKRSLPKICESMSQSRRQVVMYTGALTRHGGSGFLARAFHSIDYPNAELWICGKGYNPEVERLAAIDTRIKVMGFLPEYPLQQLLQQADVFVNPRPSSLSVNKINFPSKVLEYLSYGKPIISTWTDGLSPEYRNVLVVLESEREECLASTIQKVLRWDLVQRQDMTQRIKHFIKKHTWSVQAFTLIEWLNREMGVIYR
jgi:glycosyltransferase involved in cell wall biosynthesis